MRNAIGEVAHAHGLAQTLVQQDLNALPGYPAHHLAQHIAPGNRMIGNGAAIRLNRACIAQQLPDMALIPESVDGGILGQARDPPAMGEDLVDGDVLLAVTGELRAVKADRVQQVDETILRQHVHEQRGHRLGSREVAHRRIRGHGHPGAVLPVLGSVALGVAQRPVEQEVATMAKCDLYPGMGARPVQCLHPFPHGRHGLGSNTRIARSLFKGLVHLGYRVQIIRYPAAVKLLPEPLIHGAWFLLF